MNTNNWEPQMAADGEPGMTPELYRQNMVIVSAMEALAGKLTTNVRGLYFEFRSEDIVAHFVLRRPSREDEAEILGRFPDELAGLTQDAPGGGAARATPLLHYEAPDYDVLDSVPDHSRCLFIFA